MRPQTAQVTPRPLPITVGDFVMRNGVRLKVGKITKRGVVTLNHTCGGFAMFSHLAVLVRA